MSDASLADRLSLIVVTDPQVAPGRELIEVVRAALAAGAPAVQFRDKATTARQAFQLASALRRETSATEALLFVNDRIDLALAVAADGAHLGDDDLPLSATRAITPTGFLLGRSVSTPSEARVAQQEGADYVGVGPVFPTRSKPDAGVEVGVQRIEQIVATIRIPVVGIGGINNDNAGEVIRAGAAGVAVIRAIVRDFDPEGQTRRLLDELQAEKNLRRSTP